MTEMNPHPTLVAVGHDPIDAALSFAAAEATRHACGLHLLHVVHLRVQGPETALVREVDVERIGRQVVNTALERARDLVPDETPVTTDVVVGGVVPSLVEAATPDVRMVVLQHRALTRLQRVVTRSVSGGVAARARVPVVSVPSTWSSRTAATRTVSVGVDVPDRSAEVLRAAARVASERTASLHVVHTWDFPGAYDEFMALDEEQEWGRRAAAEIQAVLDELEEDAAGVPVQIEVRRGRAADALVEASAHSDLLVIGRHDPLIPLGSHLGPVARAVLREAECPVMLADPQVAPRWRRGFTSTAAATRD